MKSEIKLNLDLFIKSSNYVHMTLHDLSHKTLKVLKVKLPKAAYLELDHGLIYIEGVYLIVREGGCFSVEELSHLFFTDSAAFVNIIRVECLFQIFLTRKDIYVDCTSLKLVVRYHFISVCITKSQAFEQSFAIFYLVHALLDFNNRKIAISININFTEQIFEKSNLVGPNLEVFIPTILSSCFI